MFLPAVLHPQTGPGGIGKTDGTSSLVVWLKADDIDSNPANNEEINLWNDFSGYSNDYIIATPDKPVFKQTTLSGKPSVYFDGNSYMECVNEIDITSEEVTVFAVHMNDGGTDVFSFTDNSASSIVLQGGGAVSYIDGNYDYMIAPSCKNNIEWASPVLLQAYFQPDTNNTFFWFNGVKGIPSSNSVSMPPLSINADSYLGKGFSMAFYDGYIAELIVYNRKIEFVERKAIERYLNCKYYLYDKECSEIPIISCNSDTFHFYPCETRPYSLTNALEGAEKYYWYKDYELIEGANQQTLFFGLFDSSMFGYYYSVAEMSNGSFYSSNLAFYDSIKEARYDTADIYICHSDSLIINDSLIKCSGVYFDTLNSSINCDSFVTYNVTVLESHYDSTVYYYCYSDTSDPGWPFVDTTKRVFSNQFGCDSIIDKRIKFYTSYRDTFNYDLCYGDTIIVDTFIMDSDSTYLVNFETKNGCDSLLVFDLNYSNKKFDTIKHFYCPGDTLLQSWPPLQFPYYDTLLSKNGCDSIVTNIPSFFENYFLIIDTSLSINDSIWFSNKFIKNEGQYFDTLSSVKGCDSIIKLNISKNETIYDTMKIRFCAHDTLQALWPPVDTTTQIYETPEGKDSIVKIKLDIIEENIYYIDTFICEGDYFEWESKKYYYSSLINDTVYKEQACYDIFRYNLRVEELPQEISFEDTVICNGKPINIKIPSEVDAEWNDVFEEMERKINTPGNYLINIRNEYCNRIQNLEVISSQLKRKDYDAKILLPTCPEGKNGGVELSNDQLRIDWGDKTTSNKYRGLSEGEYPVKILDSYGCALEDTFFISGYNDVKVNYNVKKPTCDLIRDGEIFINGIEGKFKPYDFVWSGGTDSLHRINLLAGTYLLFCY